MTQPDYVAPATAPFSPLVLHIKDRSRAPLLESPGQEATAGTTICGKHMYTKHAWLLMDRLPEDRVCTRCEAGNIGEGDGDGGEAQSRREGAGAWVFFHAFTRRSMRARRSAERLVPSAVQASPYSRHSSGSTRMASRLVPRILTSVASRHVYCTAGLRWDAIAARVCLDTGMVSNVTDKVAAALAGIANATTSGSRPWP